MGLTISMTIEEKRYGLPFHKLTEEQKEYIIENNEINEGDEVFYSGKNYDMKDFLEIVAEDVSDKEDIEEGSMFLYIDDHNVEDVLKKTRKKIDEVLDKSDKYDPETYSDYGELNTLSSFYHAVNKVYIEDNFKSKYLFIDMGW